jgi:hypothetical protein
MPSCGMLPRAGLVRTEVSEERSASIIRVTGIGRLLVTANVATSSPIAVTLIIEALIFAACVGC